MTAPRPAVVLLGGIVAFLLAYWLSNRVLVAPPRNRTDGGAASQAKLVELQKRFEDHLSTLPRIRLPEAGDAEELSGDYSDDHPDPSWLELPQLNWDVPLAFYKGGGDLLNVEELYRLHQLNPHDQYVDPQSRQQLADLVTPYIVHLQALQELVASSTVTEFDYLLASNQLQPLRPRTDAKTMQRVETLRAEKLADIARTREGLLEAGDPEERDGIDAYVESLRVAVLSEAWRPDSPGFYEGGETIQASRQLERGFYGVTRDQMPVTKGLWEYAEFVSQEMGSTTVSWFADQGAISRAHSHQLIEWIINQTLPRDRGGRGK